MRISFNVGTGTSITVSSKGIRLGVRNNAGYSSLNLISFIGNKDKKKKTNKLNSK